jgi:hypothetical protein
VRRGAFVVSALDLPAKGQRRPDVFESFPRHHSLRAKCRRLKNRAPRFGPLQVRPVIELVPSSEDYDTEELQKLITSFLSVKYTIRTSWHGGNIAMK